jgi:hypothetical protein
MRAAASRVFKSGADMIDGMMPNLGYERQYGTKGFPGQSLTATRKGRAAPILSAL